LRILLELAPGLNGDDTTFAASGRYADCSNVRFWEARPQVIGGWELLVSTALTGVCRTIFPWTDTAGALNIGFGSNTKLQLWYDSVLYDITPASGFTPGAADGTGGTGYGTGAYSVGDYSEPSATDNFALTWSLAAWGQNLLACPRNQTIFGWTNTPGTPAAALSNAPANVTHMLVASSRQVFALGCNQESGGTFNPVCIRHSDVGSNTGWTTGAATTSREYILPGGGRIVAGRVMGSNILVWTSNALWLGTYVGSLTQIWRFDKVGDQCGLVGPNAAVVVGQRAFWIGPDLQTYGYGLGGQAGPIGCPILKDFADNLASSQGEKIVASSNGRFAEIRFDYPDSRDGNECSRYIAAHVPTLVANPDLAWYRGQMARSAFVDAPPAPTPSYPLATTPDGAIYYHDKGTSADGDAFSWFIRTADNYLDPDVNMQVRQVWPDFKDQLGPVMVNVTTKFAPQGDETVVAGTTMAPGDRKSDVRATGRLVQVEFYGNSSPTRCRIGSPTFDVTPCGGR
jgi:hypothetical protein